MVLSPDFSSFLCSTVRISEGFASFPEGSEPPCQTVLKRKGLFRDSTGVQGSHVRKDRTGRLREGWAWVTVSPHGARTFDLHPLRPVLEPIPSLRAQVTVGERVDSHRPRPWPPPPLV